MSPRVVSSARVGPYTSSQSPAEASAEVGWVQSFVQPEGQDGGIRHRHLRRALLQVGHLPHRLQQGVGAAALGQAALGGLLQATYILPGRVHVREADAVRGGSGRRRPAPASRRSASRRGCVGTPVPALRPFDYAQERLRSGRAAPSWRSRTGGSPLGPAVPRTTRTWRPGHRRPATARGRDRRRRRARCPPLP